MEVHLLAIVTLKTNQRKLNDFTVVNSNLTFKRLHLNVVSNSINFIFIFANSAFFSVLLNITLDVGLKQKGNQNEVNVDCPIHTYIKQGLRLVRNDDNNRADQSSDN
jgi:hypothetical protein